MNKNKKLVALICAMAMIFSMFAGFTVVNADEITRGIIFDNVNAVDETTVTVDVKYVGYDKGLSSYTVAFDKPAEVDTVSAAFTNDFKASKEGEVEGVYTLKFGTDENVKDANSKIATLTFKLNKKLGKDGLLITLKAPSQVAVLSDDKENYDVEDSIKAGSLPAATVTLPKYVDPNATEAPEPITTRPPKQTPAPVATEDPNATTAPTLKPDVPVTRGLVFENAKVNGSTATVDVKYVGYDKGLSSYTLAVKKPAEVTSIVAAFTNDFKASKEGEVEGVYTLKFGTDENVKDANSKIATLTITLADGVAAPFQFELIAPSQVAVLSDDKENYDVEDSIKAGSLPAAIVTIPVGGDVVVATPTPEPKSKTYTAPEIAKNADFSVPETNDGEVSNYRIAVTVTKGGQNVPYGEGFVAKLGDKELTSVEYNNLLGGYIDEIKALGYNTVQEAFNALSFKVYADGANVAVQVLRADQDEEGHDIEIVVGSGNQAVSFGPAQTPVPPTLTVTTKVASKEQTNPSSISMVPGQLVTITASAANVDSPEYKFDITSGKDVITEDSASGNVARYLAEKVGTAVVKVTCGTLTKTITINVTETEQGGSTVVVGGGDKGSVNGSIAHGSVVTNGAGTEKIAFTDLDTVTWAQDAILALVAKGVINGRSNTIFDPNGTVTRAEFAKMVVLGFDLAGGTPGNFTDVNPNTWYATVVATAYHNNVISGYDDGTFRPNNQITRQEMAAMISRAIAASKKTLPAITNAIAFDDAWQIGNWATDAVASLTQGGVITGMTDTTFAPLENATRAQAAVIINRAITNAK